MRPTVPLTRSGAQDRAPGRSPFIKSIKPWKTPAVGIGIGVDNVNVGIPIRGHVDMDRLPDHKAGRLHRGGRMVAAKAIPTGHDDQALLAWHDRRYEVIRLEGSWPTSMHGNNRHAVTAEEVQQYLKHEIAPATATLLRADLDVDHARTSLVATVTDMSVPVDRMCDTMEALHDAVTRDQRGKVGKTAHRDGSNRTTGTTVFRGDLRVTAYDKALQSGDGHYQIPSLRIEAEHKADRIRTHGPRTVAELTTEAVTALHVDAVEWAGWAGTEFMTETHWYPRVREWCRRNGRSDADVRSMVEWMLSQHHGFDPAMGETTATKARRLVARMGIQLTDSPFGFVLDVDQARIVRTDDYRAKFAELKAARDQRMKETA